MVSALEAKAVAVEREKKGSVSEIETECMWVGVCVAFEKQKRENRKTSVDMIVQDAQSSRDVQQHYTR